VARGRKPVVHLARPAMAAEGNFFSRWSRQKAQSQAQAQVQAEAPPAPAVLPGTAEGANPAVAVPAPVSVAAPTPASTSSPDPAAPTLADVAQLTPQSDFAPYMGRTVTQAVKNAALKKLFADPHFNVMDGLDIYIDDYSIPSPLSPEELKNMVAAQFIKLVDDPEASAVPPPAPDALAAAQPVPEHDPDPVACDPGDPGTATSETPHGTDPHDHPDLQLQPDDAAQRPGAEPGA
jgi:Protein of unknown function (DUF3306)